MKELTIEQLMANRMNFEMEHNAIKAHILQKVNRMEEIENELIKINDELIERSKPISNVTTGIK